MFSQKTKDTLLSRARRECLSCGYKGYMKTWLGNYSAPQFIALILCLFWLIPGLIFIAWGWGKYKCPTCGKVDKSKPAAPEAEKKKCPHCAEEILAEAVVCRYCSREV